MALSLETIYFALSKNLGFNSPPSSILSSALFITSLFFYIYCVGSFSQATINPLIDRINYPMVFQQHIFDDYIDSLIVVGATTVWLYYLLPLKRKFSQSLALGYGSFGFISSIISFFDSSLTFSLDIAVLVSLPLMIGTIIFYHSKHKGQLLNFQPKLTALYLSIVVIAIAVAAVFAAMPSIFMGREYNYLGRESYAYELFLLFSSLSSLFMVLIIFCVPVKLLFKTLVTAFGFRNTDKGDMGQDLSRMEREKQEIKKRTRAILLGSFMLISVAIALIPQQQTINPDNQDIGVDTKYYVTWITNLESSQSVSDFLYQSFVNQQDGDRPLSLIFIFAIHKLTGGTQEGLAETIEHMPVILGPGIVLALYFLTREMTKNDRVALVAAFLGAVSFHTIIGIYAGFYANWLALIVGYLSMLFMFRYLKNGSRTNLFVFFGLMVATLLFHVYTWTILAAVAGMFLIAMLVISFRGAHGDLSFGKKRTLLALVMVLLTLGVDVARASLTGSSGGIERDAEIANVTLGLDQFSRRWDTLDETMHGKLGGIFANFIILGLALLWVLRFGSREPMAIFLMVFFSIGLVTLFFGDWSVQARIFYNIPFEIPAAMAIFYLAERSRSKVAVQLAPLVWLAAIAILTVTNFNFLGTGGVR